MPIKVKFIKKWGRHKEGTLKDISKALAKDIYGMGCIQFVSEADLEKAYPSSSLFIKHGLNPLRESFTRGQITNLLKNLEKNNVKTPSC